MRSGVPLQGIQRLRQRNNALQLAVQRVAAQLEEATARLQLAEGDAAISGAETDELQQQLARAQEEARESAAQLAEAEAAREAMQREMQAQLAVVEAARAMGRGQAQTLADRLRGSEQALAAEREHRQVCVCTLGGRFKFHCVLLKSAIKQRQRHDSRCIVCAWKTAIQNGSGAC